MQRPPRFLMYLARWIGIGPARREQKPTVRRRRGHLPRTGAIRPAPAVKRCERDASPMDGCETPRVSFDFHAHHHRAAFLDFADLPELYVFVEAGHQRRPR